MLDEGDVRFLGTVPELMALAAPRRFVLQLRGAGGNQALPDLGQLLSGVAHLVAADMSSSEHFVLVLEDDVVLGDALGVLTNGRYALLAPRGALERGEAFLRLTEVKSA